MREFKSQSGAACKSSDCRCLQYAKMSCLGSNVAKLGLKMNKVGKSDHIQSFQAFVYTIIKSTPILCFSKGCECNQSYCYFLRCKGTLAKLSLFLIYNILPTNIFLFLMEWFLLFSSIFCSICEVLSNITVKFLSRLPLTHISYQKGRDKRFDIFMPMAQIILDGPFTFTNFML